MKHLLRCLPLLFGLLLVSSSAQADAASDDRARLLYQEGTKLFTESRYEAAEQAFSEAYRLSQRAGFLWNMAECARLSGAPERALGHYQKYLIQAPEGAQRADAQEWIEQLVRAPSPEKALAPLAAPAEAGPRTAPDPTIAKPESPTVIAHSALLGQDRRHDRQTLLRRKWWVWTGIAAALVAGATAAVVLSNPGDEGDDTPKGPLVVDWR